MIRTDLAPEDFEDVLDGVRQFIDHEVRSRHRSHEDLFAEPRLSFGEDGRVSPDILKLLREVRMASAEAGYYNLFAPRELGGEGLGTAELFAVYETVFHTCGTHHWLGWHMIAHWAKGPSPIFAGCSDRIRDEVLPQLLTGETSLCFALSEPDAGSDIWQMRSRAVRDGDLWHIDGEKQWITNGPYAEHALVFVVTDPHQARQRRGGVTAFIIPTDAPGLEISSIIRMFGMAGGDEAIVRFDDVAIGDDYRLGEVDAGLAVASRGVNVGKIYNAAKAVGLGAWALDLAAEHVNARTTFGQPLSKHQGVMFPLAESVTELHAATLLALNAARRVDAGAPEGRNDVAMAKAFATEAGLRAVDRVMQVHGGMGFTNEMGLYEAWNAIRKVLVADGSAEMMRRQIAREWAAGRIHL